MVSVIIPCYSSLQTAAEVGQQLWYTVWSAINSLEASGLEHEIIVVVNGSLPFTASLLHEGGNVKSIFCGESIDSPQSARDLGVQRSRGEFLFFLDTHVVIPPNFFSQMIADMEESGADFMGCGHKWIDVGQVYYGARIAWDEFLWARETLNHPPNGPGKLWKTAIHPHGAFAMRRKAYEEVGGYWLALKRFGGEESQMCLKLWMMGKSVWATPRTFHCHWLPPGARRDNTLWKDPDIVRNFMLVAAAYGDEARVRESYKAFSLLYWGGEDVFPMLIQKVLNSPEVAVERKVIAERAKYKNLKELREMFNREDVLN